jgi:2-polyprenyl-6-methoxyphenol hydroxylase-like FAD-dependent oxidoreductase
VSATDRVLIAGAGIGGLSAALALMQSGRDVLVLEQAPVLGEAGAGVQLAPDGTRLLIGMGLGPAMEAIVKEAEQKIVRMWNTGETWKLFDLGADCRKRFGAPYWFVHRGDLHKVLRDAVLLLDPRAIRVGARVMSYEQDATGIRAVLASGEKIPGAILVGADGVHSVVRAQEIGEAPVRFAEILAWRGLIPVEKLPAELRAPVGANWIGPGGHVITYPVRRGELLNFGAFVERFDWTEEGWSIAGSHDECLADFQGWHHHVHTMIRAIDTPYKWALAIRDPLRVWRSGRMVLLGDACHATLPFLAHGAIAAIEDGVMLARCLAICGGDHVSGFEKYEMMRVERCASIISASAANTKRFHNPLLADPEAARTYVATEWEPDRVRQRYDWLFEYDASRVAIA